MTTRLESYSFGGDPPSLSKAGSDIRETTMTIESDFGNLSEVRRFVDRLARRVGMDQVSTYEVKLAVGEACANAIEHGSPHGSADCVTLGFGLEGDQLRITVADRGRGFTPPRPQSPCSTGLRGYGIFLMRSLMDSVDFACSARGTCVTMRKRIRR